MKVALVNLPWTDRARPELWGVRAGSRWPHFQRRTELGALPRYIPFPFSLAIAAGVLQKAGHEVLLLDGVAGGSCMCECLSRICDFGPDVLFSEMSTPSLGADLGNLRAIRVRLPAAVLVGGGMHPCGLAADLIRTEGIPDFWLAGEYENSLLALVNELAAQKTPSGIAGLIGRNNGVEEAGLAGIEDLDALPAPLFEQLPVGNYSDPVCGLPSPGAQTWLSRGCPYRCTFCVWPQVVYGNRKYRQRSISAALDEVKLLIDRYGCESFYFDDDTTNIGEGRMRELAEGIKARGLDRYPWAMMARADCMTPAMIEALAGAGMYSVKYGVESVSAELLNACDKGTDLAKLKQAVKLTKEAGIKLHLTFTFGIPGETTDTMRQTLDFALECAPDSAQFSICTPFPGTLFYEECVKNGWLTTNDWSRYIGSNEAVVQTPWLSAEALMRGHAEACAAWNSFRERRLEESRGRLIRELEAAVAAGRSWTMLGDVEFAEFIRDRVSLDVAAAFVLDTADVKDVVTVIVSRHDEEKIYRRMIRSRGKQAPGSILRLYQRVER